MLDCFVSLMNRVQTLGCCERGDDGRNQERNTFGWMENMLNWQNTDTNANTNTNTNTLDNSWKEDVFDWPRLIFGCLCCSPAPPHNVENDYLKISLRFFFEHWEKQQKLKNFLQVLCGETAWVVSDHMASGPGEKNSYFMIFVKTDILT